ncbi:Hypothetical predicted protein [Octopus vulgaris]|uniref:Uncharacterized protein n=1 Tax=Octopus vulgaris TaxID=6645 RepID=A0AA36EYQ0_OCTVU|nr:Hypothetical predicted protein [Octopus vulgaris]
MVRKYELKINAGEKTDDKETAEGINEVLKDDFMRMSGPPVKKRCHSTEEGSCKTLDVMFGYIKAFEMKPEMFKKDVDNERLRYFPNLKKPINDLSSNDRAER